MAATVKCSRKHCWYSFCFSGAEERRNKTETGGLGLADVFNLNAIAVPFSGFLFLQEETSFYDIQSDLWMS